MPHSWEDWEQLSRVVAIESYPVPEPAVGTSGHSEEIDPIREMKTEAANVDVCEEQTDTELGKEGGDASQEPPPL